MNDRRLSVEGLRAIAVMGVVLFHFGAWWLPGGFVGVDVFFVISGYVISLAMFRDMGTGNYSIFSFYERRSRRIVPALIAVTAVTSVGACLVLYPGQLDSYARTVIAAMTFVTNIYFYWTTDYFDAAASEVPLLHYWSLGVEEQFYILFPLVALAIFRFARRHLLPILVTLWLASLIASEWMLHHDPAAAFYLLPFRAFELLTGSILVLVPMAPARARTAIAGTGGVLLIGSMAIIDETFRFPGLWALAPCVGTALVIWSGESNSVARALSAAPFIFVGSISYSLYLVHWPIAVFAMMIDPTLAGPAFLVAGTGLSIVFAWLSYRFVEQPFRSGINLSRVQMFVASGLALTISAGVALVIVQARGFPARLDGDVEKVLSYQIYDRDEMYRMGSCFLNPTQTVGELPVETCMPPQTDTVLWGSSYLAMLYSGLEVEYRKRGQILGQFTASSCEVMIGVNIPARPNCKSFIEATLALILERRPRVVIIGGDAIGPGAFGIRDVAISRLEQAGITVVVLGPLPFYTKAVPLLVADRMRDSRHDMWTGDDLVRDRFEHIAAVASHFASANYISPMDAICVDGQCPLAIDGVPLIFDVVHATREGSAYYASKLIGHLP